MHIKHIHETMEKLSQYACEEACKDKESINTEELGEVVDMIKDLSEAEYHAKISKAMEEAEKEDEEEAKYIMKKMKEEYGEEEGERRFYDNYRYKKSGRFAPKGRGSYMPIRGYDEMPYMAMPQVHNPMEYMRDVDRDSMNRMYYAGSGSTSGMGGNMGGNTRNYEDGYSDGNRKGYEEGYSAGQRNGKSAESRYDKAKRGYEEAKRNHKGNTPEDMQLSMKEAEKFAEIATDEIVNMLEDARPEVKNMVKTKVIGAIQKL